MKIIKSTLDELTDDLNRQLEKFAEIEGTKREMEESLYEITIALTELAEQAGITKKEPHGNTSIFIIKEVAKMLSGSDRKFRDRESPASHGIRQVSPTWRIQESDYKRELDKMRADKSELVLKLKKAEEELSSLKETSRPKGSQGSIQSFNNQNLMKDKEALSTRVKQLEEELRQRDQEIKELSQESRENQGLKQEAGLQEKFNRLEREYKSVEQDRAKKIQKIVELEEELRKQEESYSYEIEDLNSKLKEKEQELKALSEESAKRETKAQNEYLLQKEKERLEANMRNLEQQIKKKDNDIQELRELIDSLKEEIDNKKKVAEETETKLKQANKVSERFLIN